MNTIKHGRIVSVAIMSCLFFRSINAMSAEPRSLVRSFHLDAPPARVFPLFTAEGERAWAQGWDPEILSGNQERGSVFRTRNQGRESVWIVTDFNPGEGRASYARLAAGSNMGLVDVRCSASPQGGTEVSVRYTLTATSGDGKAFVDDFLAPAHYEAMIEEWRVATQKALARAQ